MKIYGIVIFYFLAISNLSTRETNSLEIRSTRTDLNDHLEEISISKEGRFKFKSYNYIKTKNDEHLDFGQEVTYHVFDFENRQYRYSFYKNSWQEVTISFDSYSKEYSDYILICNHPQIKEVWFNPEFQSIEHEYHSGLHYTFTELEGIN